MSQHSQQPPTKNSATEGNNKKDKTENENKVGYDTSNLTDEELAKVSQEILDRDDEILEVRHCCDIDEMISPGVRTTAVSIVAELNNVYWMIFDESFLDYVELDILFVIVHFWEL